MAATKELALLLRPCDHALLFQACNRCADGCREAFELRVSKPLVDHVHELCARKL